MGSLSYQENNISTAVGTGTPGTAFFPSVLPAEVASNLLQQVCLTQIHLSEVASESFLTLYIT
jgi:hypothetical protein